MGRLVRVDRRAWMLCAVALLWAWEATAEDPEPDVPPAAAAALAPADQAADAAPPGWDFTAVPSERVRGGR